MHLPYTFPECVAFGASGKILFNTQVYESDNADRSVYVPWPTGRHEYDASSGIKKLSEVEQIRELYHVAQGRAHSFDWKDFNDFKSTLVSGTPTNTDQILGTGDGLETDFMLYKDYTIGTVTRRRVIQRPVSGSILIAGDASPILTGWTWIEDEFLIRFDVAPGAGVALTCGYLFYVPVAFASNVFDSTAVNKIEGELAITYPIDLEEVKLKTEDFA